MRNVESMQSSKQIDIEVEPCKSESLNSTFSLTLEEGIFKLNTTHDSSRQAT